MLRDSCYCGLQLAWQMPSVSRMSLDCSISVPKSKPAVGSYEAMLKKILVVEDDPEMVELLRFTLRSAGYSVGTARDGIEGIKKARTMRPDLILLDLMLPELDGFAVCETLRRSDDSASVPILILSAMSSQMARFTGLGAGANDYLVKPFSPRNLLVRVRQLIGYEERLEPAS